MSPNSTNCLFSDYFQQMHPHFNAMRGGGGSSSAGGVTMPRLPPPMTSPHYQPNMQNMPVSVNQFNQRLVQEIQQNHPMLPFNRLNNNFNQHPQMNQIQMQHHNNNNNNSNVNHVMNGKNSQMMQQMKVNGNMVKLSCPYGRALLSCCCRLTQ